MLNEIDGLNVNPFLKTYKYYIPRYPLVFVSLAYVLGLITFKYTFNLILIASISLIIFILLIAFSRLFIFKDIRKAIFVPLVLSLFFFLPSLILVPEGEEKPASYPLEGVITSISKNRSRIRYTLDTKEGSYYLYSSGSSKSYPEGTALRLNNKVYPISQKGLPGIFDFEEYRWVKGLRGIVYLPKTGEGLTVLHEPSMYRWTINYIRDTFKARLYNNFSIRHAGFLGGLLLGDKQGISRNTMDDVMRLGLTHVLVVSGLHLTIWVMVFYFIVRYLPIPVSIKVAFVIAGCWMLSEVCGPNLPVQRAFIMTLFFLLSFLIQRRIYGLNVLASSGLLIMLIEPKALWDISFELSFLATFGIVFWVPHLHRGISEVRWIAERPVIKYVIDGVSVSVFAQLAVSPLLLSSFGNLSLISPLVNLIQVPLVNLITIVGYVYLSFASIPVLSTLLILITNLLLYIWDITLKIWLKLSFIAYHSSSLDPVIYSILAGLILICLLWRMDRLRVKIAIPIFVLSILTGSLFYLKIEKEAPLQEAWLFTYRSKIGYINHTKDRTKIQAKGGMNLNQLEGFLRYKGFRKIHADIRTRYMIDKGFFGIEFIDTPDIPQDAIELDGLRIILDKNISNPVKDKGISIFLTDNDKESAAYNDKVFYILTKGITYKMDYLPLGTVGAVGFLIYKDRIDMQIGKRVIPFAASGRILDQSPSLNPPQEDIYPEDLPE